MRLVSLGIAAMVVVLAQVGSSQHRQANWTLAISDVNPQEVPFLVGLSLRFNVSRSDGVTAELSKPVKSNDLVVSLRTVREVKGNRCYGPWKQALLRPDFRGPCGMPPRPGRAGWNGPGGAPLIDAYKMGAAGECRLRYLTVEESGERDGKGPTIKQRLEPGCAYQVRAELRKGVASIDVTVVSNVLEFKTAPATTCDLWAYSNCLDEVESPDFLHSWGARKSTPPDPKRDLDEPSEWETASWAIIDREEGADLVPLAGAYLLRLELENRLHCKERFAYLKGVIGAAIENELGPERDRKLAGWHIDRLRQYGK